MFHCLCTFVSGPHTHTCKHSHTHTHTHIHVNTHTHTNTHTNTHTHTQTHTNKHTHTQTHTHRGEEKGSAESPDESEREKVKQVQKDALRDFMTRKSSQSATELRTVGMDSRSPRTTPKKRPVSSTTLLLLPSISQSWLLCYYCVFYGGCYV